MDKVLLDGGSFNPMTVAHRKMITMGIDSAQFKKIIVVPCGPRHEKQSTNDIAPIHRAAMVDLTVGGLHPGHVEVDYFDLENNRFTPTHMLQDKYAGMGEVWHVIGTDLIQGGASGQSYIQRVWQRAGEVWNNLNFAVFVRSGYDFNPADLPPRHMLFEAHDSTGVSSAEIRRKIFCNEPITGLVTAQVESYIRRRGLYRGFQPGPVTQLSLAKPKLLLVPDEYNDDAKRAADSLSHLVDESDPNLIVVFGGDGILLRAARNNWRRRIPILGVNFGHVGYNLNAVREQLSPQLFEQPLEAWHYPLLYVEMTKPDGEKVTGFGFNDAWVSGDTTKGESAWMRLTVDGDVKHDKIVGDGMLVATPQGSTGYARSMGAEPLTGDSQKFMVVGNNIFPPTWKSAKLELNSEVAVTNIGRGKLYGMIDGQSLGEITEMRARVSRFAAVELAFLKGFTPRDKFDRIQFPK